MREHNYEHWIETFSGHPVDPLNIEHKRINFIDIAHSLSNQCRFSGHTRSFYSVAQHSVHVSELVEEMGCSLHVQLLALYHDASEAYLMDMPTPIKRQMHSYREAEKRVQAVIEEVFFPHLNEDFKIRAEEYIKKADLIMLASEARDLMGNPQDWKTLHGVTPRKKQVVSLSPDKAKKLFIQRDLSLNLAIGPNNTH